MESTGEKQEAQLGPPVGEEPASRSPCHCSPNPRAEASGRSEGQAVSQAPGSQDNLPPEQQTQCAASVEEEDLEGLPFPRKLWATVQDDAFKSLSWNDEGDAVIIEKDLFRAEILQPGGAGTFKTSSLKSFTRQLNLHGFSKIQPKDSSSHTRTIYRNSSFQRDKPEFLNNILKRGSLGNSTAAATRDLPTKRKKLAATRRSPRLHRDGGPQGDDEQPQREEAPRAQDPSSSQPIVTPSLGSTTSAAGMPPENCVPEEPQGPEGAGTLGNVLFEPLATAGTEGSGEMASRPQEYSDYGSVMSLYNTCYSILLAALTAMSPDEPDRNEEEAEGSSDYTCNLCDQFKENPEH